MTTWICADCGARYDERDPPCTECAGEQFARLEEDPHEIESVENVSWECEQCGEPHPRNSPPCKRCGHMMFEQADSDQDADTETEPDSADVEQPKTPIFEPSPPEQTANSSGSVRYRTVIAWLGGLLAAFNLLGAIRLGLIISGAWFVVALVVSLPPARQQVVARYDIDLTWLSAAVVYVVGIVCGNYWLISVTGS